MAILSELQSRVTGREIQVSPLRTAGDLMRRGNLLTGRSAPEREAEKPADLQTAEREEAGPSAGLSLPSGRSSGPGAQNDPAAESRLEELRRQRSTEEAILRSVDPYWTPERRAQAARRVREIQQEQARYGEVQLGDRIEQGVGSILTTAFASLPLLWDTAVQAAKNVQAGEAARRESGATERLREVEGQIRALEGSQTGEALDYIRAQDRWKALDAQRQAIQEEIRSGYAAPVPGDTFGMELMGRAAEQREGALLGLEGVPRFLGETAISIGQNAALLPTAAIHPALPLAAMGTMAAANKTYGLNERGVSPSDALLRGAVSGGIEAATEKIPLENLLSVARTGGTSALRNVLRQAGIEAGEESISYLANYTADRAAQDPEAEFSLEELARSAAGGALSGGVFGGAAAGYNALARPGAPRVVLPAEPGQVTVLPGGIDNPSGGGYDGAVQSKQGGTRDVRGEAGPAAREGAAGADVRGEAPRADAGRTEAYWQIGGRRDQVEGWAEGGTAYERGQASDLGAGRGRTVRLQTEEAGIFGGRAGAIPEAAGGIRQGESGTTQQAKIGAWAQGHIIERPSSPGVNRALEQIRAYTPDVVVVDDRTLQAHRPNALGLTSDGTIYLSDAIPEELSVVVPSHEIVHLLKQRENKIYLNFMETVGERIAFASDPTGVLDVVVESRYPGKTLLDLSAKELDTVYDELNALVWGYHKADPENARAQFAGVFRDYDAYIRELDAIMEAAAQAMEAGRPPEPGGGEDSPFALYFVELPREPGQRVVLPGGIDHPSGGDEGAIQTNQGGTRDARGEAGPAARERAAGDAAWREITRTDGRGAGKNRTGYGRSSPQDESERGAAEWAKGHIIMDQPGSPAALAAAWARQYGVDAFIVRDSILKRRNANAWALTTGGKVYISDALPLELENVVGFHEAVHAVRQRKNQLYQTFVEEIGGMIDFQNEAAKGILNLILQDRFGGQDLLALNQMECETAYDELNALVWGYYKADPENARAQFAGVFRDYDAYIRELDAIMEAAAQAMEAGQTPEPGGGEDSPFALSFVELPREPGERVVLPGGIDHPSGGDEGAIQTNQGGISDARGEAGPAAREGAVGADVRGGAPRADTGRTARDKAVDEGIYGKETRTERAAEGPPKGKPKQPPRGRRGLIGQ